MFSGDTAVRTTSFCGPSIAAGVCSSKKHLVQPDGAFGVGGRTAAVDSTPWASDKFVFPVVYPTAIEQKKA